MPEILSDLLSEAVPLIGEYRIIRDDPTQDVTPDQSRANEEYDTAQGQKLSAEQRAHKLGQSALSPGEVETTDLLQSANEIGIVSRIPSESGGTEEEKYVVKAVVDGHEVSLFERAYDGRYVREWDAFHRAGMPVAPFLLTAEIDGKRVLLLPDMKSDGSEFYGRGLLGAFENDEPRERPPSPQVDEYFLRLSSQENLGDVVNLVNHYATIAAEHGLRLPFDDPFELHMHDNGEWELAILDLRFAAVDTSDLTIKDKEWMAEDNKDLARLKFIDAIEDLRRAMLDQASPAHTTSGTHETGIAA